MKKYSILLFGASGKMGQELQGLINNHEKFLLYKNINSLVEDVDPSEVNLVIDFSHQKSFSHIVTWATEHKKAFLSGTTGLISQDFKLLNNHALIAPAFWAANMSVGVYLLGLCIDLISKKSKALSFDYQIEETHHSGKKDSPSGTALSLLNILNNNNLEPQIISHRLGEELGKHTVSLNSLDESLVLEHRAHSRSLFAQGTVAAAQFLVNQSAGLYSMKDLFPE